MEGCGYFVRVAPLHDRQNKAPVARQRIGYSALLGIAPTCRRVAPSRDLHPAPQGTVSSGGDNH
ncbi:hypothetical protein EYZ11_001569 [Aspergillus tanneri]|uniref:Uncharacterized protein n=1 Tax=Aspergillus tanneri TaxID=1220188 RepID=A0A4S3JT02_9EURO|nr:hypothetical protein EYZ11_001569 [Aspergillus tanneri]